ncbi:MAG: 50S ribosomal protein L30 [Candidatus Bathyarchaeota archaeon]|jgi:large subunit ribosomal protein L30|nr:50S ribosomal protein L30 [Candidatus Bathyarchaeota archaeon]
MSGKTFFVVRIRGGVDAQKTVEATLTMLRMEKNNYATILKDSPSYTGMLRKAKDYITWGEPDIETIKLLIVKRGKLVGNEKITDEALKGLGYDSLDKLANALVAGDVEFSQLNGIKPFFRMHPPKKGFKRTVKRPYNDHGELGYRGEAINELIKRMC